MNESAAPPQSSFVVVSNRLPVDRVVDADGVESWTTTPGGLVTALQPVMANRNAAWVGWPGAPDTDVAPFRGGSTWYHPVTISATDLAGHYEGMSNATIWPLYHDVISPPIYRADWWKSYLAVNEAFAARVAEAAAPHATVWVHDYQLQMVPRLLRERRHDLRIGYFHHIPFPGPGLFAQLPWREDILRGLLGADLVGCQRPADAANLRQAAAEYLGAGVSGQTMVTWGDRSVRVDAFPISLDARSIDEAASRPAVIARAAEIRRDLGDPTHVFLGVDRLDYTKGIGHRLAAFEQLLEDGSLSSETSVFVQLASPSRESVDQYRQLREAIEDQVGRINERFSTAHRPAVVYHFENIPREEMLAHYLAADVMVVTSLRDGMNLVAKEFVATRRDEQGVLVLSEFTGAADELTDALIVNPHDRRALANALFEAASMSPDDAHRRMRSLRAVLFPRDVTVWAEEFLTALADTGTRAT